MLDLNGLKSNVRLAKKCAKNVQNIANQLFHVVSTATASPTNSAQLEVEARNSGEKINVKPGSTKTC